jgi:hypothetical protein
VQLTKAERNGLWRAIVAGGLEPGDCDLKSSPTNLMITHSLSASFLKIRTPRTRGGAHYQNADGARIWPKYVIDSRVGSDPASGGLVFDWDETTEMVQAWARAVRNYSETPDLWEFRFDSRPLQEAYEIGGNSLFSAAEQSLISRHIQEIKESVKENFELSGEQLQRIEARLDEAEEASRRLGRKDWILLLSGAVFSLILTDLITAQVAEHILMMVVHGLGHLFASGGAHVRRAIDK